MNQEPNALTIFILVRGRVLIKNIVFIYTRSGMFTALLYYSRNLNMLQTKTQAHDPYNGSADVGFEEQHAGYQAAYGWLAASESAESDPLTYVVDPKRRSCSDCRNRMFLI